MFAIGLPPVFSLRWNLPPALSCNPKQLDSVTRTTSEASKKQTGLSPSLIPCSKGLLPGAPQVTHATTPLKVWQHGLFPLQSPLLRESLLVSFPPLNYMLKFGGSSCLIGDPREEKGGAFGGSLRAKDTHLFSSFSFCPGRSFGSSRGRSGKESFWFPATPAASHSTRISFRWLVIRYARGDKYHTRTDRLRPASNEATAGSHGLRVCTSRDKLLRLHPQKDVGCSGQV